MIWRRVYDSITKRITQLKAHGVKQITMIFDGESPAVKAATRAKRERYVPLVHAPVAVCV